MTAATQAHPFPHAQPAPSITLTHAPRRILSIAAITLCVIVALGALSIAFSVASANPLIYTVAIMIGGALLTTALLASRSHTQPDASTLDDDDLDMLAAATTCDLAPLSPMAWRPLPLHLTKDTAPAQP